MATARSPSRSRTRQQLLKALDEAARRLGAQTVLVSDLVATRVGLNSTDLECLDLLYLAGATTAGRLAAHTGLTSGATTAAIDRLEHAGFVTRRRDSTDRRVVLVEVVEAGAKLIFRSTVRSSPAWRRCMPHSATSNWPPSCGISPNRWMPCPITWRGCRRSPRCRVTGAAIP